ncbi:hypothetical protein GB937_001970 [Aspergillus fischeri]|nr:hypothetical protein GB937_001970 [Aspergillus fischeri]
MAVISAMGFFELVSMVFAESDNSLVGQFSVTHLPNDSSKISESRHVNALELLAIAVNVICESVSCLTRTVDHGSCLRLAELQTSYSGLATMLSRPRKPITTHCSEDSPLGNCPSTSRRDADPPFSCPSSFGEPPANEDLGVWLESLEWAERGGSPVSCDLSSDLNMLYDAIPNPTRSACLCSLQKFNGPRASYSMEDVLCSPPSSVMLAKDSENDSR